MTWLPFTSTPPVLSVTRSGPTIVLGSQASPPTSDGAAAAADRDGSLEGGGADADCCRACRRQRPVDRAALDLERSARIHRDRSALDATGADADRLSLRHGQRTRLRPGQAWSRTHDLVRTDVAGRALGTRNATLVGRRADRVGGSVDCGAARKKRTGERRPAVVGERAEQRVDAGEVAGTAERATRGILEVVPERSGRHRPGTVRRAAAAVVLCQERAADGGCVAGARAEAHRRCCRQSCCRQP